MKKINYVILVASLSLFGYSAGGSYSAHKLTEATWDVEHLASDGNYNLSTQKKGAFSVNKSIKVTDLKHLPLFSEVKLGAKEGLELPLDYNNQIISLLNIHLKNGCFTQDYNQSDKKSCQTSAKQAELLKHHVTSQIFPGEQWLTLDDFNHHLADKKNTLRNTLLAANTPKSTNLAVLAGGKLNCNPKYPAPIDHTIFSPAMTSKVSASLVMLHKYTQQGPNMMLSDHRALSATFNIN